MSGASPCGVAARSLTDAVRPAGGPASSYRPRTVALRRRYAPSLTKPVGPCRWPGKLLPPADRRLRRRSAPSLTELQDLAGSPASSYSTAVAGESGRRPMEVSAWLAESAVTGLRAAIQEAGGREVFCVGKRRRRRLGARGHHRGARQPPCRGRARPLRRGRRPADSQSPLGGAGAERCRPRRRRLRRRPGQGVLHSRQRGHQDLRGRRAGAGTGAAAAGYPRAGVDPACRWRAAAAASRLRTALGPDRPAAVRVRRLQRRGDRRGRGRDRYRQVAGLPDPGGGVGRGQRRAGGGLDRHHQLAAAVAGSGPAAGAAHPGYAGEELSGAGAQQLPVPAPPA